MAFTFTGTAAPGTSAAAGAIAGGVTPWYRLFERANASSFHLTQTFVATIQPEYSNCPDFDKGADFGIDADSYQVPTVRALPIGIGDFVRFRCTAYTSGSPKVSFAKALNPNGAPFSIQEDAKKTPAPSSVGPNN